MEDRELFGILLGSGFNPLGQEILRDYVLNLMRMVLFTERFTVSFGNLASGQSIRILRELSIDDP